jgi:hypothetical protein
VTWFVKLNYQLVRIKYKSWTRKKLFKPLVDKFIYKNQKLALWLDKKWPQTDLETQGYFVTAKK